MKKRMIAAALGMMLLGTGCLGVCASAEEDSSVYSMTREDLEGRAITLTTAEDWWNDAYQKLVDDYMEEFGVEIEVIILPSQTASEVIKSQFATGELGDIVMNSASPSELTYMIADKNLVDLSDEPWVDKLSDTSSFRYFDDKLYGLPIASQDYWGFCVNKEVFEACGLEVPTSKEELVAAFEVLKENDYIPFYSGAGDSWMCGNITSSGIHADWEKDPDLVNKFNTNQMKYADSESWKAMLQDVYDWAAAGYFGDNFMSQSWDGLQNAVANNECGVSIGLTSWFSSLETTFGEGTSDKLELIPYYIGENDTIYASTCCEWYISSYSKNIDVCKHFLNWSASDENLQAFYDTIGSASIFKGISSSQYTPATQKLMDALSDGTYGTHVSHNSVIQGQDWDTFCQLMQEVFMNNMTPDEFCEQYDEYRDAICVALGMEGF
ncbi:MAG: ABC transporter substrate-binding protein [Eubacteriales bacterium]|nr:ABC transporter substrate-binding protein [Eubacteriales bacterium]